MTDRYNEMLASLVAKLAQRDRAPAQVHIHLVTMSKWMDYVSRNPEARQLSKEAQPAGVEPFYGPGVPPAPAQDPVPAHIRRRVTTSDLARPTQAARSLIARYFVTRLLKSGHTPGRLGFGAPAALFCYIDRDMGLSR